MEWFGQAKISYTHHATPLVLQKKDGTQTDLLKIAEKATPPCRLNPLLFNGHLQTMWTVAVNAAPSIYYKRKIFNADHQTYSGTFAVDFAVPPHTETDKTLPPRTAYYSEEDFAGIGSDDNKPMLIVLHGLSGGSYELYLRHAIAPLVLNDGGWEVCVVNSRGCANSTITSGVLFNARATWDVRQVVKWAKATFPNRPLFGLGFSLGANILTNYLGEEGENCVLKGAVAVGCPFGLEIANKALRRSLVGREVYLRFMGASMKRLANLHKKDLQQYTKLDYDAIDNITYLYEFDKIVQTTTWGYPTETAYYRDASCSDIVLAIRVPYIAINAADDPIAVNESVPYQEFEQNPYIVSITTSLGGHLSWFEIGGGRWHARPISNFFKSMASQIDLDSIKTTSATTWTAEYEHRTDYNPTRRKLEILKI